MNIFKILASGDGAIKEPNLSAFLAYLLNPKADHGLGSEFLRKVLQPFINEHIKESKEGKFLGSLWSTGKENEDKDDPYILDMSINSRFNVDVVLEKALRRNQENKKIGKTKEIVDIIIKITRHQKGGNENVNYLFEKEDPIGLILLENKINNSRGAGAQLSRQYKTSIEDLPSHMPEDDWKKWNGKIGTILISTGANNICEQFKSFKHPKTNENSEEHNPNSIHLSWNNVSENKPDNQLSGSIKEILQSLLKENLDGTIPPINSYALDTMKALINFIEDDFSSDADDQQQGGKKGKRIIYTTLNELILNEPHVLSPYNWEIIQDFDKFIASKYKNLGKEYTKTHPISIFRTPNCERGTKLFSIDKTLSIHIVVLRNGKIQAKDLDSLKTTLNPFCSSIKEIEVYGLSLKLKKFDFNTLCKVFDIEFMAINKKAI